MMAPHFIWACLFFILVKNISFSLATTQVSHPSTSQFSTQIPQRNGQSSWVRAVPSFQLPSPVLLNTDNIRTNDKDDIFNLIDNKFEEVLKATKGFKNPHSCPQNLNLNEEKLIPCVDENSYFIEDNDLPTETTNISNFSTTQRTNAILDKLSIDLNELKNILGKNKNFQSFIKLIEQKAYKTPHNTANKNDSRDMRLLLLEPNDVQAIINDIKKKKLNKKSNDQEIQFLNNLLTPYQSANYPKLREVFNEVQTGGMRQKITDELFTYNWHHLKLRLDDSDVKGILNDWKISGSIYKKGSSDLAIKKGLSTNDDLVFKKFLNQIRSCSKKEIKELEDLGFKEEDLKTLSNFLNNTKTEIIKNLQDSQNKVVNLTNIDYPQIPKGYSVQIYKNGKITITENTVAKGEGAMKKLYFAISYPNGQLQAALMTSPTKDPFQLEENLKKTIPEIQVSKMSYEKRNQKGASSFSPYYSSIVNKTSDGKLQQAFYVQLANGELGDVIKSKIALKSESKENNEFDDNEINVIFSGLINGVIYLHQNGFVHRDLKPGNVVINTEEDHVSGNTIRKITGVKIIDFDQSIQTTNEETLNYKGNYYSSTPQYKIDETANTSVVSRNEKRRSLKKSDSASLGFILAETLIPGIRYNQISNQPGGGATSEQMKYIRNRLSALREHKDTSPIRKVQICITLALLRERETRIIPEDLKDKDDNKKIRSECCTNKLCYP